MSMDPCHYQGVTHTAPPYVTKSLSDSQSLITCALTTDHNRRTPQLQTLSEVSGSVLQDVSWLVSVNKVNLKTPPHLDASTRQAAQADNVQGNSMMDSRSRRLPFCLSGSRSSYTSSSPTVSSSSSLGSSRLYGRDTVLSSDRFPRASSSYKTELEQQVGGGRRLQVEDWEHSRVFRSSPTV
ncbi:hypothetical protein INR49_004190 [Caranx melampygus]|nr:hypothetical protein INR49_004190 [Caranx melampygus]